MDSVGQIDPRRFEWMCLFKHPGVRHLEGVNHPGHVAGHVGQDSFKGLGARADWRVIDGQGEVAEVAVDLGDVHWDCRESEGRGLAAVNGRHPLLIASEAEPVEPRDRPALQSDCLRMDGVGNRAVDGGDLDADRDGSVWRCGCHVVRRLFLVAKYRGERSAL